MGVFRIQDFVDSQPARPVHFIVLGLCTMVMFIDGLDIFMVGKIAPAIAKGFGEAPEAMKLVIFAQQIGLSIGAFVATPLADRYGRRTMLIASASIFGVLTLGAAFSTTLMQFAILRGLSGIFLAGGLPMAVALLAEFTPQYRRGSFIAIAMTGYSAGGAAGGAIAAWLIDLYGWQSGFWIGGLLPLAIVPLMLLLLPESLQFLAGRNALDPRVARSIERLQPTIVLTGDEEFVAGDGSAQAGDTGLFDIFREGRARTTALIWIACVFSMSNIALMGFWLPTFFNSMAGVPIQRFAVYAMISFAGGLIGTLTMGWLMDRFAPSRLIPLFYLCLAASLVGLGTLPFATPAFVVVLLFWNFFQTGGQTGINTLMAQVYPASMRSTGLGWAGGAGRVGGIILPPLGGLALSHRLPLQTTMMIVALMPLLVAVAIAMLRGNGRPAVVGDPVPT
jgi:AAHS family 4-hydroxybenzoate transporter-like MFS transporter